jgi:hypothetical protein
MAASVRLSFDGVNSVHPHVLSGMWVPDLCTAVPSRRVTVLSIGDDSILLRTRQLVLQSAGYHVRSATSVDTIADDMLRGFDLVIVCHTLGNTRSSLIGSIQRLHPLSTLTLSVNGAASPLWAGVPTSPASPQALLRSTREMLAAIVRIRS